MKHLLACVLFGLGGLIVGCQEADDMSGEITFCRPAPIIGINGGAQPGDLPGSHVGCAETLALKETLRRAYDKVGEAFIGICEEGPWCPTGTTPWAAPPNAIPPTECLPTSLMTFFDSSRVECCGEPGVQINAVKCSSPSDCIASGLQPNTDCMEVICDGTCSLAPRKVGFFCGNSGTCAWGRCFGAD